MPTLDAAPDLSSFFKPRSIAIIGASANPATIGGRPLRILIQHGYAGALFPVNPRYRELEGRAAYPSIGAVPEPVDLAVVIVPARLVPGVLEACAAAGVRYAMVISSGFAESGAEGRALQEQIRALVGRTPMRVCGPNCEGFFNLVDRVPVTFSPAIDPERGFRGARAGSIGIVSQSGGLGFALFNRGLELGLGFSTMISTGNEVDLEALDYVDSMLDDPNTQVVLAFIEAFRHGRRLIATARKAAERGKPLVVAKVGRSEAGRRSAASHTGSLAGSDEAYAAAFRQLGVVRVEDVEEMLDAAAYFSVGRLPPGRRVVVLTPSGGAGTWLADACAAQGLDLPAPEDAIQAEIGGFLPPYGSTSNPVDITAGVASQGGLDRSLELLIGSRRCDAIVIVSTLAAMDYFRPAVPDLRRIADSTDKALVYYSYTSPRPEAIEALRELGIPCYGTPLRTARALAWAAWYRAFLDGRGDVRVLHGERQTPSAGHTPVLSRRDGTSVIEVEARACLAPCGIPAPAEGLAHSADEAVRLLRSLGGPVALKVQSPDLPHKSDVGGVRLGLAHEAAVRAAYAAIMAAVAARHPEAEVRGVLVQRMVEDGVEMILGARIDPDFGPLVLVGLGGVFVEVFHDVSPRLAPVSRVEAAAMVEGLRGAPLLRGARGRPPADVPALVEAIVRFSELAAGLPPGVAAVEINPLLVRPEGQGVVMVDARVEGDVPTGG